jgi:predicted benzoate:H+ symporter BenE
VNALASPTVIVTAYTIEADGTNEQLTHLSAAMPPYLAALVEAIAVPFSTTLSKSIADPALLVMVLPDPEPWLIVMLRSDSTEPGADAFRMTELLAAVVITVCPDDTPSMSTSLVIL